MPPPPLSPAERRLGTFALFSAVLYGLSGLFFAAAPLLTLRIASLGGPISLGPGMRLWHTLAVSMMAMLAFCCYTASKAPRENRAWLQPVLLSKLVSTAMAVLTLLRWHAVSAEALSGRRTVFTVIATDFPLFLITAWLYWRAAPGVKLSAAPTVRQQDPDAPKPIALGLAKIGGAPAGPVTPIAADVGAEVGNQPASAAGIKPQG